MCAFAIDCIIKSNKLWHNWNKIASLSLDAYACKSESFLPHPNEIRKQSGQIQTAKEISSILDGSDLFANKKEHVQDPYSFRCIPQVHGATKDVVNFIMDVVETEINSVTDNPTIFPDDDLIISAGNFHGQPLALAMDQLAVAVSEIGSISERRVYKLISGQRGLPDFLVEDSGLNSGLMIPQYSAASIVSKNKQLCTPSSVDTIDSSNGQEDHVSMATYAARRLLDMADNTATIVAIELLAACQGVDFRAPLKTSKRLVASYNIIREFVPFYREDHFFSPDIETVKLIVKKGVFNHFLTKKSLPSLN